MPLRPLAWTHGVQGSNKAMAKAAALTNLAPAILTSSGFRSTPRAQQRGDRAAPHPFARLRQRLWP